MYPRRLRWMKQATLVLASGCVFGSLSCVQNLADSIGTGLSLTGLSGLLGAGGAAVNNVGVGLDLLADLIRFAR